MALKTLRKHQKKLLAVLAVLAMIAFSFDIVIRALTPGQRRRLEPIARVYGEEVYPTDLERIRQERAIANRFLALAWSVTGQRLQLSMWGTEFFGGLDRDELLEALALEHEADRLGISFTDEMVTDFIYQITGGQLTAEQFQGIVRQLGVSQYTVYAALKRQLRLRLVESLYYGRARQLADYSRVTPLDAWQLFRRINERVRFDAIPVPVSQFASLVEKPSESELRKFYEQYKDRIPSPESPEPGFRRPPRVRLQYAAIDVDQLVEEMMAKITDEQIRQYYEENKELYRIDTEAQQGAEGQEEAEEAEKTSESQQPDSGDKAGKKSESEKQPEPESSESAFESQRQEKSKKEASGAPGTAPSEAPDQSREDKSGADSDADSKNTGNAGGNEGAKPAADRPEGKDTGGTEPEQASQEQKQGAGEKAKEPESEPEGSTGNDGDKTGRASAAREASFARGSFAPSLRLTARPAAAQGLLARLNTPGGEAVAGQENQSSEGEPEQGSATDRTEEKQTAPQEKSQEKASPSDSDKSQTGSQAPGAKSGSSSSSQQEGEASKATEKTKPQKSEGDAASKETEAAQKEAAKAEGGSEPARPEAPEQKEGAEEGQEKKGAQEGEGESGDEQKQPEEKAQYRPLEEVADSIRRILAEQAAEREAQARLEKLARVVREYVVNEYLPARQKFDMAGGEEEGRKFEPPPFPDLEPIAKELGVRLGDTGQISYLDLEKLGPLAEAREVVGGAPQGPPFEELFIPRPGSERFSGAELLEVRFLRDLQGTYYAVWIRERWPEETPPFEQIRPEVEQVYRLVHARPLAKKRAEELAAELRRAGGDVQKLVAENEGLEVISAGPMTLWRRSLALFGGGSIEPVEIPGIEYPGEELRQTLLDLPINEPGVQSDAPIRTYYVLIVREREPAKVEEFVQQMTLYLQLAQRQRNQEWMQRRRRDLWREGVIELLEPAAEEGEEATFAGL